jgi:hypothetical protein
MHLQVTLTSDISEGLNNTLFVNALRMRSAGFTESEALEASVEWLHTFGARFHRDVKPGEVERQVGSAYRTAPRAQSEKRLKVTPKAVTVTDKIKVEADLEEMLKLRVAMRDFTVDSLTAESPFSAPDTATALQTLFNDDELLCAGHAVFSMQTRTLRNWLSDTDVSSLSFIVPNAMKTQEGVTQEGRLSQRSLENSGTRKRLVIECDRPDTPLDYQAGMLWILSMFQPLEMVVNTAGKSLHGWFHCFNEAETQRLFVMARMLGADHALWGLCQTVRMPGGLRYPKAEEPPSPPRRQRVIYYNPTATRGGIYGAHRASVFQGLREMLLSEGGAR